MVKEIKRIYLDNNATTPVASEVLEAMLPFYRESFGNPSSIHALGQKVKIAIDEAREEVAALLGAEAGEIVFTSGGTEADNLAIKGTAWALQERGKHIITSAIEHPAVLNTCQYLEEQGFDVTYLPVDSQGRINPEDVRAAISSRTILITIMHANNETGCLQPIAEIGKMARERGVCFHTDAVQSAGKVPLRVKEWGMDLLSVSAHKIHGPKGVGALFIRKGLEIQPLAHGGHHERGKRAGTENVAGIIGLGAACRLAGRNLEGEAQRLAALRDRLWSGIQEQLPQVRLNGHLKEQLPHTLNCSFPGIEGESLLINLDLMGVAVSTGSACASGSIKPSHVLMAMGIPEAVCRSALRFSLGRYNTQEEIDYVLDVLPPIVERLRKMSPLWTDHRE